MMVACNGGLERDAVEFRNWVTGVVVVNPFTPSPLFGQVQRLF